MNAQGRVLLMLAPDERSPRQGFFLTFAAVAQLLVAPYLLLAGMMAAEMSALLSAVLMPCGAAVGVAALFLFRRRRWAWRLSSVLAALALITGIVVAFLAPAWLGGIHAAGAAIVLGALWAGRTAIVGRPR